jgi:hypothetical protein
LPAFAQRQQRLSPDQYEIVDVRSSKGVKRAMAFPKELLKAEWASLCVSYSEGLARKHARDCRALMKSPLYRRVFPGTQISPRKDTELEFDCTLGGYRLATSGRGHPHGARREFHYNR